MFQKLVTFVFLLFNLITAKSQDTVFVDDAKGKVKLDIEEENYNYKVEKKVFVGKDSGFFSNLQFLNLYNSLDVGTKVFGKSKHTSNLIEKRLTIENCEYILENRMANKPDKLANPTTFFTSIALNHFKADNDIIFADIETPDFAFHQSVIKGNCEFWNNYGGPSFYDSKITGDLTVGQVGGGVGVEKTFIGGSLTFQDSKLDVNFTKPTFNSNAEIWFLKDTVLKILCDTIRQKVNILFADCIIDGIVNFSYSDSVNIVFKNVQFTEHAVLSLAADSITFDNCRGFTNSNIFSYSNRKNSCICFHNTDFSTLQMEYRNAVFFSTSKINNDELSSMYERSISKFKEEGKVESLKNVDIDYKKFKYNRGGFWGAIQKTLDRLWWNFGYSKSYILWWSLFFIGLFFMINVFMWPHINNIYPIMEGNSLKAVPLKQKKNFMKIFLFTVYIFFSLRIDFDKLKYENYKMLALFFFQYIVGLTCMFFVANAILKIG